MLFILISTIKIIRKQRYEMSYSALEKMKIAGYSLGSAIGAGSTSFAALSLIGASVGWIAGVTILGTVAFTLNTLYETTEEIDNNHDKLQRIKELRDDQNRTKEDLLQLKPQIEALLQKAEQEQESLDQKETVQESLDQKESAQESQKDPEQGDQKGDSSPKKDDATSVKRRPPKNKVLKERDDRVEQLRTTVDRLKASRMQATLLNQQQAKEAREKKIRKLKRALRTVSQDMGVLSQVLRASETKDNLPTVAKPLDIPSPVTTVDISPEPKVPENTPSPAEQTSDIPVKKSKTFKKAVRYCRGVLTGLLGGASSTYGAALTGAAMLAQDAPPVLGVGMVVSAAVIGTIATVGNTLFTRRDLAIDHEIDKQYDEFLNEKRRLQKEYDSIKKLINSATSESAKTKSNPETPQLSLLPGEVPGISLSEPSSASLKSKEEISSSVAIDIAMGAPKTVSASSDVTSRATLDATSPASNSAAFYGKKAPRQLPKINHRDNKGGLAKPSSSNNDQQNAQRNTSPAKAADRMFTPARKITPEHPAQQAGAFTASP
jgi:hypothetical protein